MSSIVTFGRRKIYTDQPKITRENVVDVLEEAMTTHLANSIEIKGLFDYYRGKQPILNRVKPVRPEIQDNTVVNHASEIVSFKVSYLLSEPIMYVNRSGEEDFSEKINTLNDYMFYENKAAKDKEIATDFTICGVAYRYIEPNKRYQIKYSPFKIHTLNPQNTFLIRYNGTGEPIVAGVTYVTKKDFSIVYSVFTDTDYFEIHNREVKSEINQLGAIPIIEYVNNDFMIGSFEVVQGLLDAINTLESNRIEATEQTVQSITVLENLAIEPERYDELRAKGLLELKNTTEMPGKVYTVSPTLNQADQQVLVNSLYKQVLLITGMPSTGDGSSSDSSNNGAVIVKNGWQTAEAYAKSTEPSWCKSETLFLEIALGLCKTKAALDIPVYAILEKFTRRNYEDISTKSNVLSALLNNEKVHPRFAYQASGIAIDAEEAYSEGMEWFEKNKKESQEAEQKLAQEAGQLAKKTEKAGVV